MGYFNKQYWQDEIFNICEHIDENLEICTNENRKLVSSNIVKSCRDLTEAIASFIYCHENTIANCDNRYKVSCQAFIYIKKFGQYNFIIRFHNETKISCGHKTILGDSAERIAIKYIDRLVEIKMFLKKNFSFDVLNKLNKYPLDLDGTTFSYYEKIKNVINVEYYVGTKELADSYYIQKRKTLLINGEKFYEYTLTSAFDSVSKFDRFIAYSKIKIFGHYAIKCCLCTREIVVFERKINISIIQNYWVSIRPCEIEKFGRLFGCSRKITRTEQYDKLMEYIQNNEITLSKIFKFDKETYYNFKIFVTGN